MSILLTLFLVVADQSIEEALGLVEGAATVVVVPPADEGDEGDEGDEVELQLDLPEPRQLLLTRHSLRAPDFTVKLSSGQVLTGNQLQKPATYRGERVDGNGFVVHDELVATRHPDGSWSVQSVAADDAWVLVPLREIDASAPSTAHVYYRSEDVIPVEGFCGTPDGHGGSGDHQSFSSGGSGGARGDEYTHHTEIAFESDYPFFQKNGSSVDNTLRDIELVMNGVDLIYQRDTQISWEITGVFIYDNANDDPYTSNDPGVLLGHFQRIWNRRNHIVRDVAHLMTGRNTGGTIGVARFAQICNLEYAYALSQSRFSTALDLRVQLTAHELGHNYRGTHCDAQECYVMCSFIGGCNGRDRFGPRSITDITSFRNSRPCLDELHQPDPPPLFDSFESGAFEPHVWAYERGVDLVDLADAEPSGVVSAAFDQLGGKLTEWDDLRTHSLDVRNESNLELQYFLQRKGVPALAEFRVEFFRSDLFWAPLDTVVSDGNDQSTFEFRRVAIPAGELWEDFRLRFRPSGDGVWYLDDVQLKPDAVSHTISELVPGNPGAFAMWGAEPGDFGVFFYGFAGLGDGPCYKGVCLDLELPLFVLGVGLADAGGFAQIGFVLPPDATSGVEIYSQVLVTDGARVTVSNPVATEIR